MSDETIHYMTWQAPTEMIREDGIHILSEDDINFLRRAAPGLMPVELQPFHCRYREADCVGKKCPHWQSDLHCHHPVVTFTRKGENGKWKIQGTGGWRPGAGRPKGSVTANHKQYVKFNIALDPETAGKICKLATEAGITRHKFLVKMITQALNALDIDGYKA